jgi:hypothetical protein
MKKELKHNVWIVGFSDDTKPGLLDAKDKMFTFILKNFWNLENLKILDNVLYEGKVDDIPDELSSKLCDFMFWDEKDQEEKRRYYNYGVKSAVSYPFLSPKESIKSACKDTHCVIYRKK